MLNVCHEVACAFLGIVSKHEALFDIPLICETPFMCCEGRLTSKSRDCASRLAAERARVIKVFFWGYYGTPIKNQMEKKMEKKMENEMETLGPFKGVYRDITPTMEN